MSVITKKNKRNSVCHCPTCPNRKLLAVPVREALSYVVGAPSSGLTVGS